MAVRHPDVQRSQSLLAVIVVCLAGCGVETNVQGAITEKDLDTPEMMEILVRGQSSELADAFDRYFWALDAATDMFYYGGTSSSARKLSVNQHEDRYDSGLFAQAMEASWSGIYAVERCTEVDPHFGIDPSSDPLIARAWLNSAVAERILGEAFCEAVYNFGPEGGIQLNHRGPYDPSVVVPNDSIWKRVVTMATNALEVATAGVNAGVGTPQGWYHFDPQVIKNSAHGVLAQAYLVMEEWELADQHAAEVPIHHEEFRHYNEEVHDNPVFQRFLGNNYSSLWNTPIATVLDPDPRAPFVKCGDFVDGYVPGSKDLSYSNHRNYIYSLLDENPVCTDSWPASRARATQNWDYPRWVQTKYSDPGDEIEMVTGTEMLLIRAEVALRRNDLGTFTTHINRLRAHHGLDPIDRPVSAGALEYPNAEDDAWSILDRERFLELWLEGRRYMDLRRWEHPFWMEGHYLTVEQANMNPPGPRPWMCMPLPADECRRNPLLRDTEHCAILPPPGG